MNTKKITIALVILLLAGVATINVFVANKSTRNAMSGLSLMNLEALSDAENPDEQEGFSYKIYEGTCSVFFPAGPTTNTYYTGHPVKCESGDQHPVCVDCYIDAI